MLLSQTMTVASQKTQHHITGSLINAELQSI